MDLYLIGVVAHLVATVVAAITITVSHLYMHRAFWDPKQAPLSPQILHRSSLVIWGALFMLVASGLIFVLQRPEELLISGKFQAKMVIVLILFVNGLVLNLIVTPKVLRLDQQDWENRSEKFVRTMSLAIPAGSISVLSWGGSLLLGAVGQQSWAISQVLTVYFGLNLLGFVFGLLILDLSKSTRLPIPNWRRIKSDANYVAGPQQNLHILVAEGNAVNQKMAVRLLERRGHTAVAVSGAREAVAALERGWFDVVLLDANLPDPEVSLATEVIRRKEKATGIRIPIVAMTADGIEEDAERLVYADMEASVSKPFRAQELFDVIEGVMTAPPASSVRSYLGEQGKDEVIDEAAILERIDGDEELLKETIEVFLDESPGLLLAIKEAITLGDGEELWRVSHSLRESIANFPNEVAYETALKLEMIGRGGDLVGAEDVYAILVVAIGRLKPALLAILIETVLRLELIHGAGEMGREDEAYSILAATNGRLKPALLEILKEYAL